MPATAEDLTAIVLALQGRLAKAESRATAAEARATAAEAPVAGLEKENAELRARLGKDSSISNKPSSSDPPYKGVRRLREACARWAGNPVTKERRAHGCLLRRSTSTSSCASRCAPAARRSRVSPP